MAVVSNLWICVFKPPGAKKDQVLSSRFPSLHEFFVRRIEKLALILARCIDTINGNILRYQFIGARSFIVQLFPEISHFALKITNLVSASILDSIQLKELMKKKNNQNNQFTKPRNGNSKLEHR